MDVSKLVEPATDAETQRLVGEILVLLQDKPLDFAKGVLRQAGIAAEAASVVKL